VTLSQEADSPHAPERDAAQRIQADPAASHWIKHALRWALARDPIDAAADAQVLFSVLQERADATLRRNESVTALTQPTTPPSAPDNRGEACLPEGCLREMFDRPQDE
jgi:hypothetical protein